MKIISLWSGPRNVSTALMYSFAQRSDMQVIDEPLYGHYLKCSGADHIGKEEVMEHMNTNGEEVMQGIISSKSSKMTFLKNMAHHWTNLDNGYLNQLHNIFLVRDPEEMLPSLSIQIPQPILRDTGLQEQFNLYKYLEAQGHKALVILSKSLLLDPLNMLKNVCTQLDIPFEKRMLSWDAGPRPEDGVWAKHWYHNVHKSTGFATYKKKEVSFPDHLRPLLEECMPYYKFLLDQSIKTA